MNLLEIGNPNVVGPILNQLSSELRFLPSVVMFVTNAKGFILLICNVIVIYAIARAGWTAASFHKFVDKSLRKHNNTMAKTNQAFEDAQSDIIAQRQHDRQMGYLNDRSSIHELHPAAATSRSVVGTKYCIALDIFKQLFYFRINNLQFQIVIMTPAFKHLWHNKENPKTIHTILEPKKKLLKNPQLYQ